MVLPIVGTCEMTGARIVYGLLGHNAKLGTVRHSGRGMVLYRRIKGVPRILTANSRADTLKLGLKVARVTASCPEKLLSDPGRNISFAPLVSLF